jgi:hypothetical protein
VKSFGSALANRFSPVVGCTRSWDASDPTNFEVCLELTAVSSRLLCDMQVIIDNMMNLEVLFNAETLTGNRTYRNMATSCVCRFCNCPHC